jgi:hypothetical protein
MSLGKRLERLEDLVGAVADGARPAYQTDEWLGRFGEAANAILATMPPERARRVAAASELDRSEWGPITQRVAYMAERAAGGGRSKPLAMPEGVCRVLDAHPDAQFVSPFDCEDCGLEIPHRSQAAWDRFKAQGGPVTPADRVYLTVCPLCGGAVCGRGYFAKRAKALWERQKAEYDAGGAGDARVANSSNYDT